MIDSNLNNKHSESQIEPQYSSAHQTKLSAWSLYTTQSLY